MAIRIVDPKMAAWAVSRQNALIKAEECLESLVHIHDVQKRADKGERVLKKDQPLLNASTQRAAWNRARNAVDELDRTHPKRWDKNKV